MLAAPAPSLAPRASRELERQLKSIEGRWPSQRWLNRRSRPRQAAVPPQRWCSSRPNGRRQSRGAELAPAYETIQQKLFRAAIVATAEEAGVTQVVVQDDAYLPLRPSGRGPRRTGGMAAGGVLAVGWPWPWSSRTSTDAYSASETSLSWGSALSHWSCHLWSRSAFGAP